MFGSAGFGGIPNGTEAGEEERDEGTEEEELGDPVTSKDAGRGEEEREGGCAEGSELPSRSMEEEEEGVTGMGAEDAAEVVVVDEVEVVVEADEGTEVAAAG